MIQITDNSKDNAACSPFCSGTLEIADCFKYFADAGESISLSSPGYAGLFYVNSGKADIDCTALSKNDCFYLPPFAKTLIKAEKDAEIIRITFDFPQIKDFIPETGVMILKNIPDAYDSIKKIYRISHFRNTLPGAREGILLSLINDIYASLNMTTSEMNLYNEAYLWIESHAKTSVSAKDVAEALGCSREHLGRVVKSVSGECLGDIIASCRLAEIKKLCRDPEKALSDICKELDFYSAEQLCKFFKYHMRMSISDYRKTV